MIIHLIGTIVAYAVYIKLSSLGDGYLVEDYYPSDYQAIGFTRTWFAVAQLKGTLHIVILVHYYR